MENTDFMRKRWSNWNISGKPRSQVRTCPDAPKGIANRKRPTTLHLIPMCHHAAKPHWIGMSKVNV